ncbi:unnamed protein product [Diabrotica balteata]|uniref:Uncharacterized protein n=1 Tax=Diabrotica balteata TaxID=107213 RepID=A0A9N9STN5_DIABA|nr:unnamed protein product [Diabrotica balteata]
MDDTENVQLPNQLLTAKFAAARSREIQVMNKNINTSSAVKLAFQKLPQHMRRRAMSHNVKRLPRRLREIHLSQMIKSGLPPKSKRPTRKYRRRPCQLISEYTRRTRKVAWLNTHIWHAKRFHIIEKWGYKLPNCPCDKAFRACYRATMGHCLIQDISYYNCVEISGTFEDLVSIFKTITDEKCGLSLTAKAYLNGSREGSSIIFRPDNHKPIGLIYFNWRPKIEDNKRTIWLWCHAAFDQELKDMFIQHFQLTALTTTGSEIYGSERMTLRSIKNLSRFRLTGPLSNAVLHNAFKIAKEIDSNPEWVKDYFQTTKSETFCNSLEYWEQLKTASSPSEVSPHLILPLIVADPRYTFPKKRTKSEPVAGPGPTDITLCGNFSESQLWDTNIRDEAEKKKISNAIINELRQNLLVPGTELPEPPALFPIILIQRPGKKSPENRGYGSGWDIILPSAWAQPMWISLVMWGGRAGGLRETDSILFESGYQHHLHPDTLAGEKEENEISAKCKEKFFKMPLNKRTNFAKFGISSPLDWNWKLLLTEWSQNGKVVTDFFVLRDKKVLKSIQDVLTKKSKEKIQLEENCLVPVQITSMKRGNCRSFSVICLPHEEDLAKEPKEPKCKDVYAEERKSLRRDHKQLLKRLRKRRIREKKKGKIIPIDQDLLKNYTNKMRKLWLPEPTIIRKLCTREVMGFVKHGGYSFLASKSKAIGYITAGALSSLLSTKSIDRVLVRNTHSRQYRLGRLNVICE